MLDEGGYHSPWGSPSTHTSAAQWPPFPQETHPGRSYFLRGSPSASIDSKQFRDLNSCCGQALGLGTKATEANYTLFLNLRQSKSVGKKN